MLSLSNLDAAIEEIREIREINEHRRREQAKKDRPLCCPDCKAELTIEDDSESPHGVKLVFIKHAS